MLLSDGDIRAELDSGRVAVEPFSEAMIQPSSIDVRLDRWFRVFENHKYSVIDPRMEQPDRPFCSELPRSWQGSRTEFPGHPTDAQGAEI